MKKLKRIFNKLILRLPIVRKVMKENKRLRKENQVLTKLYLEVSQQNIAYRNTLEGITSNKMNARKNVATKLKEEVKVQTNPIKNKTSNEEVFVFEKKEIEDEVVKKAEEIASSSPYGMASKDYSGEPIIYQELTKDDLEDLFKYTYGNVTKEVKLDLGNNREGILESHTDKTLSVELYENGVHKKSMKTGKKVINNKVVSDYSETDIVDVLNSFSKEETSC